jgi:hypothetical protein
MKKDYTEIGHETYGTKCEWVGCEWDAATTDVHHINYQQHQKLEDLLRTQKNNSHFQLAKDDDSKNLAVLCPNHHRYTHSKDIGLKILQFLPERIDTKS